MFKIIRKRKWNDLVDLTEYEIALLETEIEYHSDIIEDGIPEHIRGTDFEEAHWRTMNDSRIKLNVLCESLRYRNTILRVLKGG